MENVKAKSALSFNLNLSMLMLQCGRNVEAQAAMRKVEAVIQALPADLFVDVEFEAETVEA
jgi:hypothetical protein